MHPTTVWAASQGPNSPGTMTNDASEGAMSWITVDNAKISDDQHAYIVQEPSLFNFDKIQLIKADGSISSANRAANTQIQVAEQYISFGSESDSWGETWTPADINDVDFGVMVKVVGDEYTQLLKATNFGFSIPSYFTIDGIKVDIENSALANGYSARIDHIRITVYYSCPTPLSGNAVICEDSASYPNLFDDGTLPTPSRKAGGVDTGTGLTNTASLTMANGVLQVNANQTLVVGSLILTGGSLAMQEGATIKIGSALFAQDADNDGFALASKVFYVASGTPTPVSGKRLNTISTLASIDCNDASYSVANSCCEAVTLYADQDGDGYGAGSPETKCAEAGWVENNTDCKDTGVNANLVWVTASCYQDADNDDYGSTTAITCTNNATCTSATAGAVNAGSDAATGTFAANNTDCKDTGVNANLVWVTASCYQDADNDDYGSTTAITCTNNATCTSATAGAVNAGSDAATGTFAANNTDCKDAGTNPQLVWVTASCYQDADNDNYGNTTAITCTDNATCSLATAGAQTGSNPAATGTFAANNTDCCDSSNIAYPGATTCSATALTGCTPAGGQYDYNCSGSSTKCGSTRYTRSYYTLMECVGSTCKNTSTEIPCYNTTAPACGAAGFTKSATTTRKQSCGTCGGSNISCYTAQASTAQACQ